MALAADPKNNPNAKPEKKKDLAAEKPVAEKPAKAKKKRGGGGFFIGRLFGLLVSLALLGLLGAVAGVAFILFYFGHDLPDYSALSKYDPPIVTRTYASDGRLLAEFAFEKRVFVSVDAVPKLVVNAFISAEDKNFWTHKGVDPFGILRAIKQNIMHPGRRLKGASTITQQVAKNFLLKDEVEAEKGDVVAKFGRKIREAILSFRIEQALPKNKILELYLNEIYLGARSYGVAAASLEYFNKPLDELTLEEAAFLAGLPKAPSDYDPDKRYDAAFERRNYVLKEMQDNGFITKAEYEAAIARPIKTIKRENTQYVNHPYFAEEVRRKLLELYGEDGLMRGGLIAHSTLVPEYQQQAELALRHGLINYDMRYGLHSDKIAHIETSNWHDNLLKVAEPPGTGNFTLAVVLESGAKEAKIGLRDGREAVITLNKMKWAKRKGQKAPDEVSDLLKVGDVWFTEDSGETDKERPVYWLRQIPNVSGGLIVMDPHTGRIFAVAGGFSFDLSWFNRATQAIRQPGSAFKPFVYLAGLEAGFTPATLILDAPFVLDQGPGMKKWAPKNYTNDFGGPTTMRVGLEKSRNLMTVRLANYVGMDKIVDICNKFGVIDNLPPMLSMSIGAGETTLLRMVSAYSTFVNGGKKITPTLIDRVQDRHGKTIFVHDKAACEGCGPMTPWNGQDAPLIPDSRPQIADPRNMYQIVSMLEGVVQRGTATSLKSLGRPVAGKTGTTNESKDAWFIGFTPDLIVGTYVGYDEPKPLGAKETGGHVAAPIVKEFMERALKDVPPVPFRVPPGIRLVQINPVTGTRSQAGDEKSILEAFVDGTEPGDEPMMFTGQSVEPVSGVTEYGESVNTGLGGLY
ncbi:MAG TPA: penicillin-binding protein 1A [Patescibacteria group bacterium]|nr:penicillin-binding protein 1A [Patescibacteria group bacterium]